MSLDFVLIPISIIAILWLVNQENNIFSKRKKKNSVNEQRIFIYLIIMGIYI